MGGAQPRRGPGRVSTFVARRLGFPRTWRVGACPLPPGYQRHEPPRLRGRAGGSDAAAACAAVAVRVVRAWRRGAVAIARARAIAAVAGAGGRGVTVDVARAALLAAVRCVARAPVVAR